MMKSLAVLLCALALTACSEKPQQSGRTGVASAWQGTDNGFSAADFKRGDRASWEQALRERAVAQNEFHRIGTAR